MQGDDENVVRNGNVVVMEHVDIMIPGGQLDDGDEHDDGDGVEMMKHRKHAHHDSIEQRLPSTVSSRPEVEEEDEECRCGRRVPCRRLCCCCFSPSSSSSSSSSNDEDQDKDVGWCPCCCCCKVRTRHVVELCLLSIYLTLSLFSLVTTMPTFFLVGVLRNVICGFLTMTLLLIYVPIVLGSCLYVRHDQAKNRTSICRRILGCVAVYFVGTDRRERWIGRRFRVVANGLYALVVVVSLTLSVFVVLPKAYELDTVLSTLGDTSASPLASAPDTHAFGAWLFKSLAVWGPYETHGGSYRTEVYVYKSGFPSEPRFDDCDSQSRSYRPYLELEVHFPDPPVDGRRPPILFHTHGGGWTVGDRGLSAWSFAYFLDRGYAVVSSQYSLACYGYSASEMVDDLRDAFEYVQANASAWGFDSTRVHFVGGSAGGHLSLMTAYSLRNHSAVRSVYNLYGVTDWTDSNFLSCHDRGTSTAALTGGLAFVLANRSCATSALRSISPAYLVDGSVPLTVTFHGTLDSLVPYGQAKRLHEALDAHGVPNALIPIETFDHVPEVGYNGIPSQMHRYVFIRLLNLARWD